MSHSSTPTVDTYNSGRTTRRNKMECNRIEWSKETRSKYVNTEIEDVLYLNGNDTAKDNGVGILRSAIFLIKSSSTKVSLKK